MRTKMNTNDCKYLNVFATKIVATVAYKYFMIMKSNFYLFVEGHNTDDNVKEETIRTCKI